MVSQRAGFLWAMAVCAMMLSGCLSADDGGEVIVPATMGGSATGNSTGPTGEAVLELSGSWSAGVTGCGTVRVPASDGIDHAVLAINETAQNLPFRADYTATVPAEQYKISFFDGDVYLAAFRTGATVIHGHVPPATTQALFSSCGGAEHAMTFLVTDGPAEEADVVQHGVTHWRVGVPGCADNFFSGTDGYDHGRFFLVNESADKLFEAHFDAAVPAVEYGLSFYRDQEHLESFESAEPTIPGRVPVDATQVVVWSCGGANITLDFVVRNA